MLFYKGRIYLGDSSGDLKGFVLQQVRKWSFRLFENSPQTLEGFPLVLYKERLETECEVV